ncbi:hypothetical protein WDZ92_50830, partial [Nostoc sp. NIES-2111]
GRMLNWIVHVLTPFARRARATTLMALSGARERRREHQERRAEEGQAQKRPVKLGLCLSRAQEP